MYVCVCVCVCVCVFVKLKNLKKKNRIDEVGVKQHLGLANFGRLKIKEKNRQEIKQSNQFNTWGLLGLGGCKLTK